VAAGVVRNRVRGCRAGRDSEGTALELLTDARILGSSAPGLPAKGAGCTLLALGPTPHTREVLGRSTTPR
jgi:hypothetical protein